MQINKNQQMFNESAINAIRNSMGTSSQNQQMALAVSHDNVSNQLET